MLVLFFLKAITHHNSFSLNTISLPAHFHNFLLPNPQTAIMPTYTIIVQNDHNANGQYAVFNAPPTVDAEGSSPEVYTNAWISSFIPDGGNTTITTTQDFYACKTPILLQ